MQYLFPSSGLVGLVESTKDSEAAYKLWHDKAAIGRVLAGAIMAALNSQKFAQKFNQIEKQQKSGKFKNQDPNRLTYQLLGTEALKALTVGNPDHIATLAALTAKAFLNSKDYPPHIVEQAFWALAWKTSSTAAEIEQVYTGMSANELQLSQPYHKEQDYDPWKNAETNRENAETLLGDPFLATYIGAGYNVYDAPLPPNLTYGESFYLKTKFPACGEDSALNAMNIFLWDNKAKKFETTKLEELANKLNIDVALTEDEININLAQFKVFNKGTMVANNIADFIKGWDPLKQLIWFYKKFSKPNKSQDVRDVWTAIVSGLPNVDYLKGNKTCEINAGIENMQAVLKNLLHLKGGSKEETFTELCNLFSTENNKWEWRTRAGQDKIEQNTNITIDFYRSGQKMFDWQFLSGHFVVHTLVNAERWQNKFGKELLKLSQQMVFPEINFYVSERLAQAWLKPGPLFWTLAYSNLYSEAGKKAVITELMKNQVRAQYSFVEKLMKQMPTTDRRIQEFIVDRLLYDKGSIEQSGTPWMKEMAGKFEGFKDHLNIFRSSKNGYLNFVKYFVENGKVNVKEMGGATALTVASEYGPPDIIKYLIANGANVNARDKYVGTALDITRNSEIKSYLENIMNIMSYPSDKKKFKTPLCLLHLG